MSHYYRYLQCAGCGHVHPIPIKCGNRFCAVCGRQSLLRTRSRISQLIASVPLPPGYLFRFITLSVENQADPVAQVKRLVASFRRLRQRSFWRRYVSGGAYVIEIKGHPDNWHIHLHVIVSSKFLPWRLLFSNWKQCSFGRGVFIETVSGPAVVRYVTKYVTKQDLPQEDQLEISGILKGFRLFNPFGSWHHLVVVGKRPAFSCPVCGISAFFILSYRTLGIENIGPDPPDHRSDRAISRWRELVSVTLQSAAVRHGRH